MVLKPITITTFEGDLGKHEELKLPKDLPRIFSHCPKVMISTTLLLRDVYLQLELL